jgi:hypothetical protein
MTSARRSAERWLGATCLGAHLGHPLGGDGVDASGE